MFTWISVFKPLLLPLLLPLFPLSNKCQSMQTRCLTLLLLLFSLLLWLSLQNTKICPLLHQFIVPQNNPLCLFWSFFFALFSSKNQPATLGCKDYGDVAESGWENDSRRQMKRTAFTCILFQRCIKGIFYCMYVYIIYDFQQWGCFNSKLILCHFQRSPTESFSHTCGTAGEMEISIAFLAIMNRRIATKFSTDI